MTTTSITLPVVTEDPLDLAATWRRVRLPALLVLLVLGVAVALAVVQNAPPERPLDPRDASPVGARALAQLVRDRGVDVTAEASTSGLPLNASTTVFVPDVASVPKDALQALAGSPADVVAIAPGPRELTALAFPATRVGVTSEQTLAAGCTVAVALVAGDIRFSGLLYRPNGPGGGCYRDHGADGLLVQQRAGARTVVFGSASTFINRRLGDNGDAALALGLLSSRPHLLWLLPQLPTHPPADAQHKSIVELLPARLLWALLQLLVCVVVVGLWRARRLGAVVVEPLPVVVRAAETVEGRARLLRAARARGTAATALRAATTARLRDLFGLGTDATAAALVEGVARRTGRAGADIDGLLYGADPPDDAALVRLADDLDRLEQAVRSS
ncbi:MAG: hypothetical protein QOF18_2505 [Frankiaceae bacterium]|nr:hypothetical protein [Frankiaceae bacterium]